MIFNIISVFGMHLLKHTVLERGGWGNAHSDIWRKGCMGQKRLRTTALHKMQMIIIIINQDCIYNYQELKWVSPIKPYSIYLYTLAVSPSLGGSRQHKRNKQKQWGFHSVLPAMTRDPAEFGWHCWSNTTHPPPSSTTYVAS